MEGPATARTRGAPEQARIEVDNTPAPLLDPRRGDAEDDKSSPKQTSLLALAGSLLVEISLPKLLVAWLLSVGVPAVLLGLAPLVVTTWIATVSATISANAVAAAALLIIFALGWVGGRPLFRNAEASFWSLNAFLVQPAYTFCREALRHAAERLFAAELASRRARVRAAAGIAAALVLSASALGVAALVWPASHWVGSASDFLFPHRLILPTLANAFVVTCWYLAGASLLWGMADALMETPLDLTEFDPPGASQRGWRVAHLSDLHAVGERYGFRLESGRAGPGGNARLEDTMKSLAALHAARPMQLILVTGDMTDAGRSSEWAEFLEIVARYPTVASRLIVLPGNHDLNIIDRANPARFDLPFSPAKRLRQVRALSAMATIQGTRVLTIDPVSGELRSSPAPSNLGSSNWKNSATKGACADRPGWQAYGRNCFR